MRSRWLLLSAALISSGCQEQQGGQSKPPAQSGPAATPAQAATQTASASGGPAKGTIGNQPFVPDTIILEGRTLSFRKGKDIFPEQEIKFDLPEGKLEPREWKFEGDKFENPTVLVSTKNMPGAFNWPKDYTLVLKITSVTSKAVEGSIDLTANQPAGTHLRCTFTATRKKTHDDPLDADDAPYLTGKVKFVGPWKEENLNIGFAGVGADGKHHSNISGTVFKPDFGWIENTSFDPQRTSLAVRPGGELEYRHTHMPAGRYILYVQRAGVTQAWKIVDVKPGAQQAADLTIDPSKGGELTATLPDAEANVEDFWGLKLVPAGVEMPGDDWHVAFRAAESKKGEKTISVKGVPAGKYRAVRGKSSAEVEIVAGQKATVTLVREEPKKK
jgi:hypothetical protein